MGVGSCMKLRRGFSITSAHRRNRCTGGSYRTADTTIKAEIGTKLRDELQYHTKCIDCSASPRHYSGGLSADQQCISLFP